MPKITVSAIIKKPKEEVYKLVKNMEDFPSFMRDVKKLKVAKRLSPNRLLTSWETEIDGAPLEWKEEDDFDDANYRLNFSMTEGSYKEYQGFWLIQDHHRGAKLTIEANFDWGVPVLEKFIGNVLEAKARRGLLGMLRAIKNKAEKS